MGFFKSSKFGSLINFESLNRHWPVLLHSIRHQLDREGIKEIENGERGGEKVIILNISIKRVGGGDYSREAINQMTAIIRGNVVVVWF